VKDFFLDLPSSGLRRLPCYVPPLRCSRLISWTTTSEDLGVLGDTMNCFVIMPFAADFEDVYGAIKQAVESATAASNGRCFRLDEARPAGRISDRLLGELRSATLCVADITGTKPNVMWELGFAMALGKPAIVVTQSLGDLPFDIRDMQTIEYQRNRLSASLSTPLKKVILDTLANANSELPTSGNDDQQSQTIGMLLSEVGELKRIISEVVGAWRGAERGPGTAGNANEQEGMVGHWYNIDSHSHAYTKIVRGELVTPYCYMGNEHLTGLYFGWRRTGDYWFARYRWITADISGFSFLKRDSTDSMLGAWWSSEHEIDGSEMPPKFEGVPAKWVRLKDSDAPPWAKDAFREIEREGLASYFARHEAART